MWHYIFSENQLKHKIRVSFPLCCSLGSAQNVNSESLTEAASRNARAAKAAMHFFRELSILQNYDAPLDN